MKAMASLVLALAALTSAQAQVFRPEAVNGALLGGIAGAVIGHNSGSLNHNGWQGAAIGAGAGYLLGQAVGASNDAAHAHAVPVPAAGGTYLYRRPATYDRYWSGYYDSDCYGYGYAPTYGYRSYGYGRGAANGLWLGALAGGIIGHNSGEFHHNGWRGAAWGAGIGWLLGSIADANRREAYYTEPAVVAQPTVATSPQPAAQPVTIINNYYGNATPMSSANALFGR